MPKLPEESDFEAGKPVSASALKAMLQTLKSLLQIRGAAPIKVSAGHNGIIVSLEKNFNDGIQFTNSTGSTIPAYAVMAWTNCNSGDTVQSVAKPSTTFYRNYLVNGSIDVPNGQSGMAQNGEYVHVLYNSSPSNGDGLGPVPGQWYADIGYPETGTVIGVSDSTNKIAKARWKQIAELLVMTDSSISKGSSGACTILKVTGGGSSTATIDSSYKITAASPFVDIAANKLCEVTWINGYPALTAKECP